MRLGNYLLYVQMDSRAIHRVSAILLVEDEVDPMHFGVWQLPVIHPYGLQSHSLCFCCLAGSCSLNNWLFGGPMGELFFFFFKFCITIYTFDRIPHLLLG
ncbi:hypothetical protein AB3S75_010295 [Citrus x aurantiifolia]